MGFSFILLLGVFGVILLLLFRNPIMKSIGENKIIVKRLKDKRWFQNHWIFGIILFVLNAFLFLFTGLILYGVMILSIPFIHLFVMFLAVVLSVLLWMMINQVWKGEKRDRLIMGAVGSSFFILLAFLFIYQYITLEPTYPGEDTFMRAIGLIFGIIVTSVAFLTCFIITGFSRKKITN